jgi:ribosomal protein S6
LTLELEEGLKLFEGMFLFDTNLAAKDWPGLERHVQELLQKNHAELAYSERWPDRKLCYEIKGAKKGTYYLTYFKAPPQAISGIQRDALLSERILRLLVLHDEELAQDCEKRIKREITGSPEEIEDRRERLRREAEGVPGAAEPPVLASARPSPATLSAVAAEEPDPVEGNEPDLLSEK